MELRTARLCLDCEEVHDLDRCPVCGSETFTFLTRWVPATGQRRPRPTTSEEAEVYKQLIAPDGESPTRGRRLMKPSLLGVAALGIAGWLWRRRERPPSEAPAATTDRADLAGRAEGRPGTVNPPG